MIESIPSKKDLVSRRKACVIGRFCTVPFNNSKGRLKYPVLKNNGELIPCEWDEAYNIIKENLMKYKPEEIAVIASSDLSNEAAYILSEFCQKILQTENIVVLFNIQNSSIWRNANYEGVFQNISRNTEKSEEDVKKDIREGKIKALYLTERLDKSLLEFLDKVEFLIVQDIFPSTTSQRADIILPTTTFLEDSGTFLNSELNFRNFHKVAARIGKNKPDWQIICELASLMNESKAKLFKYSTSDEIYGEMTKNNPNFGKNFPNNFKKYVESLNQTMIPFESVISNYLHDPLNLRIHYRREEIFNHVPDLKQLIFYRNLKKRGEKSNSEKELKQKTGFRVLSNKEIALNFYKMIIEVPLIAKKAKPGNFIILMKEETSERVPLTISDWSVSKGTIDIFFQEAGYSTMELAEIQDGDYLYSVVGPLGNEIDVGKFGTVLLAGGCYGNGAIYPLAKAMKSSGNKVIVILEARNENLLYLEKEFEDISDQVIYCTSDGSKGLKGKIQTGLAHVMEKNTKINRCFFIGCTYMMRDASNFTKENGNIPTFVSLNTIMIDGTGMCGCCRLSIIQDGKEITKFACVDGPFFNGHQIKWDSLMTRNKQFKEQEISIYQKHSCKAIEKLSSGENGE